MPTNTHDENKHPRDTVKKNGRFAGVPQSVPELSLETNPAKAALWEAQIAEVRAWRASMDAAQDLVRATALKVAPNAATARFTSVNDSADYDLQFVELRDAQGNFINLTDDVADELDDDLNEVGDLFDDYEYNREAFETPTDTEYVLNLRPRETVAEESADAFTCADLGHETTDECDHQDHG